MNPLLSPSVRFARILITSAFVMFAIGVSPGAAQTYVAIHNLEVLEGNSPSCQLVDAGGVLFGTAPQSGGHGQGSVYKVDEGGVTFTDIHDFNTTDGANPYASLVLAQDGFLYGVAEDGGAHSSGVVYKLDENGNNFSDMHDLDGANEGGHPFGRLVVDGTTLYGVAHDNGANNFGTVFKIDTAGTNYGVIYVFGSGASDGSHPHGGLLLASDGRLYGTTEMGHNGSGLGTVFGMDTDGGNFKTLHTFTGGDDGQDPMAELIEGTDGFLYGTTIFGGSGSGGVAFKVRKDGTGYVVIHPFAGDDGIRPNGALTQIPGGLLYGTGSNGGSSGGGTLFHLTTSGTLFFPDHPFAAASGSGPAAAPTFGTDSALYGTAADGGAHNVGVVYRFTIPTLTSIAGTSGTHLGGSLVFINGTGFQNPPTVTFGGSMGTGVIFVNDTQVKATSPALAPGTLNDVVVGNPDGTIAYLQNGWLSDFLDVPRPDPEGFHDFIEAIFRAGITAGIGNGNYGIDDPNTRAQMAVFILRAKLGHLYVPPPCVGAFNDVPCPATVNFPYSDYIEDLFNRGITAGCTNDPPFNPPVYCPDDAVTRAQMAVFLIKGEHGPGFPPAPCVPGFFEDVPCPATPEFPYSDYIQQLFDEGVTGGCQPVPHLQYCPDQPATRGQMAVFLFRTFLQ